MKHQVLLGLFVVASFAGCGGGQGSDQFKGDRGEVSGKITVGDKPVPEGTTVVFQSKEGTNFSATGATNAAGEYKLVYNGSANLPAVTYTATVFPPAPKAAAASPMSPEQMSSMATQTAKAAKPVLPFNPKYGSALSSELEFTVKKGKNTADFKLTE